MSVSVCVCVCFSYCVCVCDCCMYNRNYTGHAKHYLESFEFLTNDLLSCGCLCLCYLGKDLMYFERVREKGGEGGREPGITSAKVFKKVCEREREREKERERGKVNERGCREGVM